MHIVPKDASENAHFTSLIMSSLYQTRIICNCGSNFTQKEENQGVIEMNKMQLHTAWIKHVFKQANHNHMYAYPFC